MAGMEMAVRFLGWSLAVNIAMGLAWFGMFSLGHEFMYKAHSRFFKISEERFDSLHYGGMLAYKLLVIFFNLVPLLVLALLNHPCGG